MTVADLILCLQALPQDATVCVGEGRNRVRLRLIEDLPLKDDSPRRQFVGIYTDFGRVDSVEENPFPSQPVDC